MKELKGQLTFRGVLIGSLGCVILTAASAYTALRMGALPWPIVFAAIVSLFLLKIASNGSSTLHEANVTHTIMSAGSMVAGGLAFTIPGAWMLGYADQIDLQHMLLIALSGVLLGLVCTALIRKHFIEDSSIEFPIGEAAAQTLLAGEAGGDTGKKLFGAMGLSGLITFLRDGVAAIPSMFATLPLPGVAFGVYASPMMLAIGYLVGASAITVWFIGALLGNFGIIIAFPSLGISDTATAQGTASCLGMGVMMGSGIAVIVRDVIPKGVKSVQSIKTISHSAGRCASHGIEDHEGTPPLSGGAGKLASSGFLALTAAFIATVISVTLDLSAIVSITVVILAFVTSAMSAQSVGQTGIDPMEIFGLIVLLLISAFADVAQLQLFFIAALIAVACGLAGDVMNDFKAGYTLGTNPNAQILGQVVGGIIGALVSVAVLHILLAAYGPESFGPQGTFVAAQASVVATMVSGIPYVDAFSIGIAAGFLLYLARVPSMMLGLGFYLPFYMSLTAFLGCMIKVAIDWHIKRKDDKKSNDDDWKQAPLTPNDNTGLIIASGLLGGESIVGILLALAAACSGLTI